jgi:hypothetical protein
MRNAHRPMGRFFCLLTLMAAAAMLSQPVQAQASGPAMTQVVEGLFGKTTGAAKKNAALTLAQTTLSATDMVAGKEIIDPAKFQDGLSKLIDAVVQCLNASVWSKTKA